MISLYSLFAKDEIPVFHNPDANIVDITKVTAGKHFEDNIVIVDKYSKEQISVKIHVYDGNEWVEIGTASLNEFDSIQLFRPRKIKFENKRFFAIEPDDDNIYSCRPYIQRDDLYIEVRDKDSDPDMVAAPEFPYSENAVFFQRKLIRGKFDENLKIRNSTTEKKVEFVVYAYHSKEKSWILYGTARTGGKNSLVKVSTDLDLGDYEYFAIYTENKNEYNYTAMADDDDLIITITYKK